MILKHYLLSSLLLLTAALSLFAQETITVSGTVSDNLGPVIGVGVVQKGTTNGVATDIDGNYSITVSFGSILVFESIGYISQEIVADRAKVDVLLAEDNFLLDELVVVGYGVQKKSDLTGAISSVKEEDLENRAIASVESALQGKTSGVQLISASSKPGSTPSIRVRGFSSNGTSDPLYVVDGLRLSSLDSVDPSTIASMEILKDAASAAIYGAQAGNGVVLITTKSGKKGNGTVSYDMQYSIMGLARRPKLVSAQEYITLLKEMDPSNDDTYLRQTYLDTGIWDGESTTDWLSATFGKGTMQKHTLSFQRGGDEGNIFASLNYYDENGIVIGDRDTFKRISGTVNTSYKVKPWFRAGANIGIDNYKSSTIVDGGGITNVHTGTLLAALLGSPLVSSTYAPDALPEDLAYYKSLGKPLFTDDSGNYYSIENPMPHPLVAIRKSDNESYGLILNGTAFGEVTPIKDLVITSKLGFRYSNANVYSCKNKYFATSMDFYEEGNPVSRTNDGTLYYQWENYASWHKSFADVHNADLMAGMSFSQNDHTYTYSYASDVMRDDPLFRDISYASGSATKDAKGFRLFNRNLSYYARAGYNYGGKYYVQVVFRADAADTSILPASNRWGYFPGVSAGWNFTNEEFFPELSWLKSGKVRASWGQNGSTSNLGNYIYSNSIIQTAKGYPYGSTPDYVIAGAPGQVENPGLKWETSEQLDLGIDLVMLDSRLTVTADWYRKETKDLIVIGSQLPFEVGNNAAPVNAGNVLNTGLELDLSWKDTIGDFSYGISANAATLKNRVTYLDPSISDNRIYGNMKLLSLDNITAFEVGNPVWFFYGYKVKDIFIVNGNPEFEDISGDGVITEEDRTCLGSAIPKLTGGITFTASWKGLDFILFGSGAYGNKVFSAITAGRYNFNYKEVFDNRWTPSHRDARFASPAINSSSLNNYLVSDANVWDASYFKIKQIQLGYTLPQEISRKYFIERLRVFFSLDDFFCFTKYPGLDPEVSASSTSGMGIDYGTYPNTRKTMFGINLTF